MQGDTETVETEYHPLRFDPIDGKTDDVGKSIGGIDRSEERDAFDISQSIKCVTQLRA